MFNNHCIDFNIRAEVRQTTTTWSFIRHNKRGLCTKSNETAQQHKDEKTATIYTMACLRMRTTLAARGYLRALHKMNAESLLWGSGQQADRKQVGITGAC